MGLVSSRSNNAEAQDLRHNFGGFTGAFHPMVGKLVGGQALGVKRAETGLVSEQRPAGHGQAPGEQNLDGGIEPKNGDTGDRKSTRLNSSHTVISYAVFCLKKKTQHVSG